MGQEIPSFSNKFLIKLHWVGKFCWKYFWTNPKKTKASCRKSNLPSNLELLRSPKGTLVRGETVTGVTRVCVCLCVFVCARGETVTGVTGVYMCVCVCFLCVRACARTRVSVWIRHSPIMIEFFLRWLFPQIGLRWEGEKLKNLKKSIVLNSALANFVLWWAVDF